jgi:hypothetical protein
VCRICRTNDNAGPPGYKPFTIIHTPTLGSPDAAQPTVDGIGGQPQTTQQVKDRPPMDRAQRRNASRAEGTGRPAVRKAGDTRRK